MSVKQERHDEAEILEMAAKLVEANKAKMNSAAQRQLNRPTTGGQSNLLNFLTRSNGKAKPDTPPSTEPSKPVIDERSQKGQFGWTQLGSINIPFIYRGDDKYCAVKMVEVKVLNKYLSFLHQDIYNCTCIRSYYITEAESRLLSEINFAHCDGQYGRDQYSTRDLIVRLHDAVEFYKFLDACYTKLLNGSTNLTESPVRCGFIRINKESVVPYTVYNEEKYVPLFYFEGETDNLKLKANKLEGWDLSYLKFCCKVQGIRNELFAHDSCSVISLNDIKNYFPPGTLFEDYWPNKMVDSQLLINGKSQTAMGQWTRQPAAPPVTAVHPAASPKAAGPAKPANNNHIQPYPIANYYSMSQNQQVYPTQTTRASNAAARATYATSGTSVRQTRPTNYVYMPQAPPPLIRAAQQPTIQGYTSAQTTAAPNYMMLGETGVDQSAYRQGSPQLAKYPPPLAPVRHINGMRYTNPAQNHYATNDVVDLSAQANANQNHTIINQQPAHQQNVHQPPHSTSSIQEDRSNLTNGRLNMSAYARKAVLAATDASSSAAHVPFKIRYKTVEGKMIPCINMKPYAYNELLVTLNELAHKFFNNAPVQTIQHIMQLLRIEMFKGTSSQMRVLVENGNAQNVNDSLTLVKVHDVLDFMPQLKYMLMNFTPEVPGKRQLS